MIFRLSHTLFIISSSLTNWVNPLSLKNPQDSEFQFLADFVK